MTKIITLISEFITKLGFVNTVYLVNDTGDSIALLVYISKREDAD